MADIVKINLTSLDAEQLRKIAFDTIDPLGTQEDAVRTLTAYARLKSLESLIDAQLKMLDKRLEAAAKKHKGASWSVEGVFKGLDAKGGIEEKTVTVNLGETNVAKEEILADMLRSDLGVSDAIVDDATDTVTFHIPKGARSLMKDMNVVPINDRAVKREISLGNIDGKYVVVKTKPIYGANTTISTNSIKEAN